MVTVRHITLVLVVELVLCTDASSQLIRSTSFGTTNWADVSFADTLNGWICGETTLMRTTDGGETWTTVNNISGLFHSVSASGRNGPMVALEAAGYNYIVRTTDMGVSWDTVLTFCNQCISNIYFTTIKSRDSLRAWVATGARGLADEVFVLRTLDAGQTWTSYVHLHGSPPSFTDLSVDADSGVATLFAQKSSWRSQDDGAQWMSLDLPESCNAISITPHTGLWAVGDSGLVFFSPAYGNFFFQLQTSTTASFNAVASFGTQGAWVVGTNGVIIRTSDGGGTWQSIQSGTTVDLNRVCFVDSNYGWIVGDSGIVLQIRGGSVMSVPDRGTPAGTAELFQNYPNPFNPSTTIEFRTASESFISLKIFDVLGREVDRLVGEKLPAGNYSTTWNAANMPSGIYFFHLTAGGFIQTRKLVLLR